MNRPAIFLATGLFLLVARAGAQETAAGYSRQIQVQPLMRTATDAAGQPLVYPQTEQPQITAVMVEIPPGAQTGWHKHPYPCVAYILSGSLSVEMEGGKVHEITAGQALAESVNILHNGRNTGTEPVKLVMFVMGEKDKPFTVKASPQAADGSGGRKIPPNFGGKSALISGRFTEDFHCQRTPKRGKNYSCA